MSASIPEVAARSRLTLAGMGTCIDAIVPLDELVRLETDDAPPELPKLVATLTARAVTGTGGEIRVDWPEGPSWLRERLRLRLALGGSAPQAARVLAAIGAPVLLALEDRSAYMLARLPAGIGLAEKGHLVDARDVAPHGTARAEIFIFEFTAGVPVGGTIPPRSSRIITRFSDPDLDHDPEFSALSERSAGEAGAGLLSGFSAVHASKIARQLTEALDLAGKWRKAGLATIHLEMATFADTDALATVLDMLPGNVTSLGMNESEFRSQVARNEISAETMVAIAGRLGLSRLCVHADRWAASVTLGDPDHERQALVCGSLLAAARASAGEPTMPRTLPEGIEFAPLPFPEIQSLGAWTFIAVASPYLTAPATTLGLGDTFTAGCLLILGQQPVRLPRHSHQQER